MKKLVLAFLLFSSTVFADITISWIPGEDVPNTFVDEWEIYCTFVGTPYLEAPIQIPDPNFTIRSHTFIIPDGENICKMRAISGVLSNPSGNRLSSIDSEENSFFVVGGIKTDIPAIPASFTIQ